MKNILTIIIMLGILTTAQPQQFTISGNSKDFSSAFRKPEVAFLQDYFHTGDFLNSTRREISEEGKFSFNFTLDKEYGYLRIGAKNIPTTLFSNILLVRNGDSVEVHRDSEQKLYFTGKGASLLNYQIWLGAQMALDYKKYYGTDQGLLYQKASVNKLVNIVEDTLASYREEWGGVIYDIMKHASTCALMRNYISTISPINVTESDSIYNQKAKIELQFMLNRERTSMGNPPRYIIDNFFYTNYLFTLIDRYISLNKFNQARKFDYYYREIEKFESPMRDRLWVYAMLSKSGRSDVYDQYSQIRNTISDVKSKQRLKEITRLLPGAPLKDFDFQDRKGNKVKLSDFEGKVLIIKTWYYGCPPCAAVSKMLEPVIEHYQGNKDIVFLTINCDKKKETFEKGIDSGLYGNESTSRFVYTNGLGFHHPMILYYSYSSAPNLLVVGKDNNIISSNPPRREDNKVVQEWVNLIDNALKK